jgi:hypothetical protein
MANTEPGINRIESQSDYQSEAEKHGDHHSVHKPGLEAINEVGLQGKPRFTLKQVSYTPLHRTMPLVINNTKKVLIWKYRTRR